MTTPERTRAIRIPRSSPDTTIEMAVARLCGGAKSPTRGSTIKVLIANFINLAYEFFILNCGVTVVNDVRNVRKQKTGKELVMQRPSLLRCRQIRATAVQARIIFLLTKQFPSTTPITIRMVASEIYLRADIGTVNLKHIQLEQV